MPHGVLLRPLHFFAPNMTQHFLNILSIETACKTDLKLIQHRLLKSFNCDVIKVFVLFFENRGFSADLCSTPENIRSDDYCVQWTLPLILLCFLFDFFSYLLVLYLWWAP
jgi:hypothetical protein